MVTNLIVEAIVAIITVMAGSLFWQLFKREKFLLRAIHDGPYLSQLISTSTLDNPSPLVAPYIERLPPGYFLNIQLVMASDRKAIRQNKVMFGCLAAAALVGSYFLGVPYLIINAIVFFLSALARVSQSARANAAQQLLTLAIILDRWHLENGIECEDWIKQAWSLRPLYDAVKHARGTT